MCLSLFIDLNLFCAFLQLLESGWIITRIGWIIDDFRRIIQKKGRIIGVFGWISKELNEILDHDRHKSLEKVDFKMKYPYFL